MNKPESKCRYCTPPERHEGCHSTCPYYAEYQQANKEYSDFIREQRKKDKMMTTYKFSRINQVKREKGRK